MKTSCKLLLLCSLLPLAAFPQASLDSVIAAARKANPELIASRHQMEAEMKTARTGIYLPNPEIQFDYLWSDPAAPGNRIDFGISQSFSFPTLYVHRSNRSGLIMENASFVYQQKEREVIHKARLGWIRLVGINKRLALMDQRVSLAGEIAGKAAIQLSSGEIDRIRYHHAQMEYVNLKQERTRLIIERTSLQNHLNQYCGGKIMPVTDTVYPPAYRWSASDLIGSLPSTPSYKIRENEILIRSLDKNIVLSEWLPQFKAGYYSETVPGLRFQGITSGISIPLFQNGNTLKAADLRIKTANAELDQYKSQRIASLISLITKRDTLSSQVSEIRSALLPVNDVSLLKKGLYAGEINVSEFYYESSVFYTAWFNLINLENDLAETEAEVLFEAGK